MDISEYFSMFGLDELCDGIQSFLARESGGTMSAIDPKVLLGKLFEGDFYTVCREVFSAAMGSVGSKAADLKSMAVSLLVLGILSAALVGFSELFEKYGVQELCFYVLYLCQVLILLKAFYVIYDVAEGSLQQIILFLKLMMPTYYLMVGIVSGSLTAGAGYQLVLFLIYGVEEILGGPFLEGTRVIFFLGILEGMQIPERLGRIIGLLQKGMNWCLKGILGAVAGFHSLQAILMPALERVRGGAIKRLVAAIPGIGNSAENVLEITFGAVGVIRTCTGVLFVVLLLAICAGPLLEIGLVCVTLKTVAAVSGIVSDRRLSEMTERTAQAGFLLLRILGEAVVIFLVIIASAAATIVR